MKERKRIYLSKPDADELRKYCKGCQYFDIKEEARDICSIVSWYNRVNIQEVLEYAKHCPCNQKCLVKPSCKEETCPMWMEFVHGAASKRNTKLMEDRCKAKNSPANNA